MQAVKELVGEVLLTWCLASGVEPTTDVGLILALLDDEGAHHVDEGPEAAADERRAGVMQCLLDMLVHLGTEQDLPQDLHVLDIPALLGLGPKVHRLVGGLG